MGRSSDRSIGAGLAIAPPSIVAKGQYQIIQGHLDDLDRLRLCGSLKTGSPIGLHLDQDHKSKAKVGITIYGGG